MSQINIFNGGLNTRVNPTLLQIQESTECINVDLARGCLQSHKADTTYVDVVTSNIYWFNKPAVWVSSTQDRSYVEFQEKLYYSDGTSIPQKSSDGITWKNLGIAGPIAAPTTSITWNPTIVNNGTIGFITPSTNTLVANALGNLVANTYEYKIVKYLNSGSTYSREVDTVITYATTKGTTITITEAGGYHTKVYRKYLGTYKLVTSGDNTFAYDDNVLDISANATYAASIVLPLSKGSTYSILHTITSGSNVIAKKRSYTIVEDYSYINLPTSAYADTYAVLTSAYYNISSGIFFDLNTVTTTRANILLDGTYQYCYTYYNSVDGSESMPSPYSTELLVGTATVTTNVVASTDTQADKIRLYRLGGAITAMSLVVELTNATQAYYDILSDINIIGDILTSQANGQAISGMVNLIEANAMFFGSKGSTLYYSDIGYVNNWSPFNFIVFDDVITGIGALQTGVLVFTKYKTYIVTGNSPDSLSKYLLSGNQGCLLHKSIRYINNTLIWLSSDGLCYSNGNDIKVGTRDKLNKLELVNPSCAIVYDDVYYISHSTGTLAIDTRFGFAISTYSITPDSFAIKNDVLYYSKTNVLYSFATALTEKQLTYRTPSFSDGSTSGIKTYKSVYVSMEYGTFTISIYIDDVLVSSHVITKASDVMLIPHDKTQGYYISFRLVGTGSIREIEYKAQGRQNGR